MKGKGPSRWTKKASLNKGEMNGLWLSIWKAEGEVNDSETIKRALRHALIYHRLQKLAISFGLNLDRFIERVGLNDE